MAINRKHNKQSDAHSPILDNVSNAPTPRTTAPYNGTGHSSTERKNNRTAIKADIAKRLEQAYQEAKRSKK